MNLHLRHALSYPYGIIHRLFRPADKPGRALRILLFHDIPETDFEALGNLIGYINKTGQILTPEDAGLLIDGKVDEGGSTRESRTCYLLSFDDGFVSNFVAARHVLDPLGVKALFFVCAGLIDKADDEQEVGIRFNIFDNKVESGMDFPNRLMSWDQLRRLKSNGHAIGCHGMSHRRLSSLDVPELETEVVSSGDKTDSELDQETSWFAFPFGDIDSISQAALELIAERYKYCRSGIRGINQSNSPPSALCADSVPLDAPFSYQRLILEGAFDKRYRAARQRLGSYARSTDKP